MNQHTAKTVFPFEPGGGNLDLSTSAATYETPAHFQDRLADLAQLQYLPAEWAVAVEPDQSTSATVTVDLMAGNTVVKSVTFTFNSSDEQKGERLEVDLFNVGGAQRLSVKATLDNADAGKGAVKSWLAVNQPLVVGAC